MLDKIVARRDEIYAIARKHKAEKLWVFGSCARREERPDSDIDLLVQFQPGSSLVDHVYIHDELAGLLAAKVDVVSTRGLHPYISKQVWGDRDRVRHGGMISWHMRQTAMRKKAI